MVTGWQARGPKKNDLDVLIGQALRLATSHQVYVLELSPEAGTPEST